jgi:hypothetical protein
MDRRNDGIKWGTTIGERKESVWVETHRKERISLIIKFNYEKQIFYMEQVEFPG